MTLISMTFNPHLNKQCPLICVSLLCGSLRLGAYKKTRYKSNVPQYNIVLLFIISHWNLSYIDIIYHAYVQYIIAYDVYDSYDVSGYCWFMYTSVIASILLYKLSLLICISTIILFLLSPCLSSCSIW